MQYSFATVYNMEKFWIVAALLCAIILTTVLAVYIYCARLSRERKNTLLLLQTVIIAVQTGQFLTVVAAPAEIGLFVKVQSIGLCLWGLPFFLYCYATGCKRYPGRRQILALSAIPCFALILVLTNDFHRLFYLPYDVFYFHYQPAYYYTALYNCLLAAGGIFLYHRKGFFVFSALFLLALIDILEYLALPLSLYDLSPVGISAAELLYLCGNRQAFAYRSILQSRMKALDCINHSVVITDNAGIVLYANKAPLNILLNVREGTNFYEICPRGQSEQGQFGQGQGRESKKDACSGEFTIISPDIPQRMHYAYYVQPIEHGGSYTGGLLYSFRDISEYKKLIAELDGKHKELTAATDRLHKYSGVAGKLAEETERQKIAGQVNATAGHYIAQIIGILENIEENREDSTIKEKIRTAIECAQNGIKEVRASVAALSALNRKEGGAMYDSDSDSR